MSEIEDGMGFSGLVPTAAERKQDEYENSLWDKIRQKERRVLELEQRITELAQQLRVRGERMETMFKYNKDVFGVLPAEWLGWFDADGQVNPPEVKDEQ